MSKQQEFIEYQKRQWNKYKNNYQDLRGKENNSSCKHEKSEIQTHVHEFESSTKLAEENKDRHNHRVAGVTSQVIPLPGGNHKHVILSNTDFFDHHHEIGVETDPATDVGNGKHVHVVKGITTLDDGHFHNFEFTTQIQSPLLPLEG